MRPRDPAGVESARALAQARALDQVRRRAYALAAEFAAAAAEANMHAADELAALQGEQTAFERAASTFYAGRARGAAAADLDAAFAIVEALT